MFVCYHWPHLRIQGNTPYEVFMKLGPAPALIQEILVTIYLGMHRPFLCDVCGLQSSSELCNSFWCGLLLVLGATYIQYLWSLEVLIILIIWWSWSIQIDMLLVRIRWGSFGDECFLVCSVWILASQLQYSQASDFGDWTWLSEFLATYSWNRCRKCVSEDRLADAVGGADTISAR